MKYVSAMQRYICAEGRNIHIDDHNKTWRSMEYIQLSGGFVIEFQQQK